MEIPLYGIKIKLKNTILNFLLRFQIMIPPNKIKLYILIFWDADGIMFVFYSLWRLCENMPTENENDKIQILEGILDTCAVGIVRIEGQNLTWVNAKALELFGYDSREEVNNKNFRVFFQTPRNFDFDFVWQTISRDLSDRGIGDYEVEMVKKDGTLFPAHVHLSSAGARTALTSITATVTDISQRRSFEKGILEKERFQGVLEMAGAICHEINQPLQAILGYAELLVMDPESATSKASLENIKNQADRLGKITATLANINQYKTLDYPGNTKIVDIWGAGPE